MSHKGRPGPWAPFRDLIGTEDWSLFAQPFKYMKLQNVLALGSLPPLFGGVANVSDEIDYIPGGESFKYRWSYTSTAGGGPASLELQFSWLNYGKNLHAFAIVDGPHVHAEANLTWPDFGNFRTCIQFFTEFAHVDTKSTNNAAVWDWGFQPPLGAPILPEVRFDCYPASYSEIP